MNRNFFHVVAASSNPSPNTRRVRIVRRLCVSVAWVAMMASPVAAQVRTKAPDRDTYNPVGAAIPASLVNSTSNSTVKPVVLTPLPSMVPRGPARLLALSDEHATTRKVAPAAFEDPVVHDSVLEGEWQQEEIVGSGTPAEIYEGEVVWDESYGADVEYGCDSCYDGGCDSACDSCTAHPGLHNASLCLDPCQWFGSLELLLLFREGDLVPSLVTTSPSGTLGGVAGELPAATTLAGGESLFKDLSAGGRLTLGTWLDSCRNRSLVFRGWTATEADYSYSDRTGINSGRIIAVPTRVGNAADAVLIAFPNSNENFGRFGSVDVSASSNVFGGDVSVRQFWTGGLGTTYDVLYGYQFMRLNEDLQLSTSSTKTQDPFPAAIGSTLSTTDLFSAENEFHGGQFGLAGRYREGCWSFDWLGKVGFGQMRRQAERRGQSVITTNSPPPNVNVSDTGLLINDDIRGEFSSSTFGWVPEFDVSIGWHKYPRFDVTFGYNIIAMTDAVRLSGVMDPRNAVDTTDAGIRYDTFVLQGMHFGIRHVY